MSPDNDKDKKTLLPPRGAGNYNSGWMKYSTSFDSSTIAFLGAAMNTTTNESILAGQFLGPSALSPLAFGLGGLAILRRRQL
jgi:hypothetical protein